MEDHAIANGIPPQLRAMKSNAQSHEASAATFNGLDVFHQIPTSQLPPSKPVANINRLTQQYTHLNVSSTTLPHITPTSSPKPQSFQTSTPVLNTTNSDGTTFEPNMNKINGAATQNSAFSPISRNKNEDNQDQTNFKHSASSQFTNIGSTVVNSFQNVPLSQGIQDLGSKPAQNQRNPFINDYETAAMGPVTKHLRHSSTQPQFNLLANQMSSSSSDPKLPISNETLQKQNQNNEPQYQTYSNTPATNKPLTSFNSMPNLNPLQNFPPKQSAVSVSGQNKKQPAPSRSQFVPYSTGGVTHQGGGDVSQSFPTAAAQAPNYSTQGPHFVVGQPSTTTALVGGVLPIATAQVQPNVPTTGRPPQNIQFPSRSVQSNQIGGQNTLERFGGTQQNVVQPPRISPFRGGQHQNAPYTAVKHQPPPGGVESQSINRVGGGQHPNVPTSADCRPNTNIAGQHSYNPLAVGQHRNIPAPGDLRQNSNIGGQHFNMPAPADPRQNNNIGGQPGYNPLPGGRPIPPPALSPLNTNIMPGGQRNIPAPVDTRQNTLAGGQPTQYPPGVGGHLSNTTELDRLHQQGPPQIGGVPAQKYPVGAMLPPSGAKMQTNLVNNDSGGQQANVLPPPPSAATQVLRPNLHANRYPTARNPVPQQTLGAVQPPLNAGTVQPQVNSYQPQQQQPAYNYNEPKQRQQGYTDNYNKSQSHPQQNYNQLGGGVVQSGFNRGWGQENVDLLQCNNVLPPIKVEAPRVNLGQEFLDAANCSPDIFRCTMTKIPESNSLLQKSRLPLGVLIHPFKDLNHLPVIQCSTIVRCRACRTYINPFVFFADTKRWKCNLCYRINELPEEFQFDPVTKTYGDPSRRPEIKGSTIEYVAPSEYMLRPPQPAVYIFLLDISHAAIESGYLHAFCTVLAQNLNNLPGDARTQVGFIAYNSALHFYSLGEGLSQPHEMTVLDIEDVFLPCPDNLVVNLHERMELVTDFLVQLTNRFNNSYDNGSALGAALQAAHKMISGTGGRITVFQSSLPNIGPGALVPREDPSQRSSAEVQHLNPANDFYKRLALECSGQQIAVDLFVVNSQYVDLSTISGISRFSGGCMHHFPLYKATRILQNNSLEKSFTRYLTRKIGFEAVMRIRCTRGLSIHTFHGNFFVRSTDLLSLPNVNPDAGFGMQVSIEENLSDLKSVCFQAALLYTSSKGERRIRVHTLCVPIANNLTDVVNSADQQCIIGLLAKMAVDRSMQSSLSDAREAFINVAIDIFSSYRLSLNMANPSSSLLAPHCLKLLPLYISALLKHVAFRTGTSTRLDDRIKAMCDMKTLPLSHLIQQIYPDLYPVHNLEEQTSFLNEEGETIPQPPLLQLSARSLESKGAYLMDLGDHMILLIGPTVTPTFLKDVLDVSSYDAISEEMYELPVLKNPHSQRLCNFINFLNDEKPFAATLQIMRENSAARLTFIGRLIEDRIETALSYHEFLQHLKTQVK